MKKPKKLTRGDFSEAVRLEHVTHFTKDLDRFMVSENERRSYHSQESMLLRDITRNDQLEIPALKVRVMKQEKGAWVEIDDYSHYYSDAFREMQVLLEGHKFELLESSQIPWLGAIRRYNRGAKAVEVPYEIVDSRGIHHESYVERQARNENIHIANINLAESLQFYSSVTNTMDVHMTKTYVEYLSAVKNLMSGVSATKLTGHHVKAVISTTGHWTRVVEREFKHGRAAKLDLDKTQKLVEEIVEYANKIGSVAGANLEPSGGMFLVELGRFVHKKYIAHKPIEIDAFVDFLQKNPKLCEEDRINPRTKKAIFGYWKRMELGKIEQVYNEFEAAVHP